MLALRLREVGRHVVAGHPFADIGTDHARLPAYLVGSGHVPSAIGIDDKPGPLTHARHNLAEAGVHAVELRQGDGLQPLRPGEVHTVTLAGMGGGRIVSLLDAYPALETLGRAVLQPNTDWPGVRTWIARRRLGLVDETIVAERGHFYLTLVVDPRVVEDHPWVESPDACALGPRLLKSRPEAWRAWIAAEHERLSGALVRAQRAGASDLEGLREAVDRFARHRT